MTEPTGPAGPTIIEPVDFRRRWRPPRRPGTLRRRLVLIALLVLGAGLAGAGWLVLTGRQVELTFDPAADHVEITGPPPRIRLQDRYLLRPGTYTVHAVREGHHPLDEPFVVTRGAANEFRFAFRKRPGLVSVQCVGAPDPAAPLDGVEVYVDETCVGTTPLAEIELEPGVRIVRLERERYQDAEGEITVEGAGHRQTATFELRPDWAEVEIATRPVPADVWVDGEPVATTPCRFELGSGNHEVELRAEGFEPWRRTVAVVAEQPVALTDVVLDPVRGRLLVETTPPAAQVTVDGVYAGLSPVEVPTLPDRDLVVRVVRDGYEPAQRTARVGPRETTTVAFELVAQLGTVRLEVSPPDASLRIDGAPWEGETTELTLPATEHRLEFSRDGYHPAVHTVRPRPGLAERLVVTLEPLAGAAAKVAGRATAANGYHFVLVRPEAFRMGASRREQGRRSNETLRTIRLERPYLIGVHEVTNEEFKAFRPQHKSGTFEMIPLGMGDRPVVQVTWEDAARFCNWLSVQDGLPPAYVEDRGGVRAVRPMTTGYRLPTEAEWEYAARTAGTGGLLKYPWGATFPPRGSVGNYADESASDVLNLRITGYQDGHAGPAPAGSFAADALGLHDMGGNAAEWCHDFYTIYSYDPEKVVVDPLGPDTGQHHVVRGSSWRHSSISALRLSYRDYSDDTRDDLGFRICRYLTNEETPDAANDDQ